MKRSLFQKRFTAVITGACLAAAATGILLLTRHLPATNAPAKTEAPAMTVLPATAATGQTVAGAVALPSVSVRGEVITAYLATVPERAWHESTTAQPPPAVPSPEYPAYPHDPPVPGVPIINSPLRPPDSRAPESSEK